MKLRGVIGVLILGVFLCVSSIQGVAIANTMVLRLAHEMPTNHPYHLGAEKFAKLVNEGTQGAIKITIYPNAMLGKQKALAQAVSMGRLDFCLGWNGILEAYAPITGIFALPYIYRNWDHTWKVINSNVGRKIFSFTERKGIKVVGAFYNGTYSFVSRKPIKSFSDIKGIKLRVQPSQVFVQMGKVLGAVVTPLAFSEVYTALQLGTIDAEIQGPINVRKSKHYEVAKYVFETKMCHLLEPLMMSERTFRRLSPKYRNVILQAAKEATAWQWKVAEKAEKNDRAWLATKGGMKFYPANMAEGKKVMQPLYDKYKQWKSYIQAIEAIK